MKKIVYIALLAVVAAGCSFTFPRVPTTSYVPPQPPFPHEIAAKIANAAPVVMQAPLAVSYTKSNGLSLISVAPTNRVATVQWMMRPISYSVDISTNLVYWRSLGSITASNLAPGQVIVSTNIFPSGQAVVFTNGSPVIIFTDYDTDTSTKFYRIREVQN